ncbi:exocyst complex component Sec5 [Colletotrichum graminicola]|uniref:Exocyst complex component SEC5 n=1 Tax=Colletotrichum graminicola (strain M1.001 / M2 / FGSC 10212) TaxID=645133 RepID=E3QQR6_COLGM|nr:exocyst complex component Sec5 [Colletotrichum graminicola M1.001]EFQ33204.1 exocyst complex component Sec5 [Colletotrichum graminicola M1.001]WDK17464.1 exocyst complex component Sec5 [Colletotrichum graminicola]
MASDYERTILDFYQLPTPYPNEWPAEKDQSDASDDDEDVKDEKNAKLQRRKSRYQALERAVSDRRSIIPGSQSEKGGIGNIVQRDEPDPLGTTDSVVRTLRQLGVPIQDDPRLRNRFLLSSTTFSPALFLSQMHATADTQSLLAGLDTLSQSIDQKSASLKVLVETNFERFVKAKATIDNVYREMKYRGAEPPPPPTTGRARAHSRHASRSSFRGSISNLNLAASLGTPASDARKKNALIKESEYGVAGIKAPLLDVSAKAEDVWGPALGGRDKEENLKVLSANIDQFKDYVELSSAISDSIKRRDYESLVDEYNKARKFSDNARALATTISTEASSDTIYQIVLAARMWHDVDEQIQAFKRDVWRKLVTLHGVSKSDNLGHQDQHMELISLLLELGVDDNPIWVWLLSRYDHLKGKIQSTSDRSKVEVEVLRRRLANADKPGSHTVASHLRSLGQTTVENKIASADSADIIELWEKMLAFLSSILSPQGILGEVVDFWQIIQGFMDGKIQRTLPLGYNGESQRHHQFTEQGADDLQKGTLELVDMIRETVFAFFAGPPPEDISLLFSPLPLSPMSPSASAGNLSPSGLRDPRLNLDPNNIPPPSPKRGETWEKLAFWPPWSNSVSGVHYLSKMLALVGSGASDLASIGPVLNGQDVSVQDRLKSLVNVARERCVIALCAAWNKDAENIKFVEDWHRSPELGDLTRMPSSFSAFEGALLAGMQKILYISEAMSKPGAGDIVLPPPNKLLQMVRSQYVTTLYKALSGMVENAERSVKKADDDWTTDTDGAIVATAGPAPSGGRATLDAGDRNVRMLLTLSNLQALRAKVVPSLNSQFENAFSVKLSDESKTIKDVLGQIDARLFQSYTRPSIEQLRTIVRTGVTSPDWSPESGQKPSEARPYVYEALLSLVLVHSQVSTTAPTLTSQVLSYLLEQTSRELLEAFRTRPRYTLEALMQATLDVEFVAQTLSQYTTDRASQLQSEIYQELDGRTDNDARARLQSELPEMRSVLKRLREASKNEFSCFRKIKRPGLGPSRTGTADSISSITKG